MTDYLKLAIDSMVDKEVEGPRVILGPTSLERFVKAVEAAHTAKLLAEVEMPEPLYKTHPLNRPDAYSEGQMEQYAAAAAAQARNQALEEAKELLTKLDSVIVNLKIYEAVTAIEQLKEKS